MGLPRSAACFSRRGSTTLEIVSHLSGGVLTKILAVDDEEMVLEGYRVGFGATARVFTTQTGKEAAQLARAEQPELVVLDLRLRDGWGITLIRRMRLLLPHAKIALVSGYVSVGSAVSAIRAGADLVLPKPVQPRAILREVYAIDADADAAAEFPSLATVEWDHIMRALTESEGNVSGAARLLGMRRTSLQRKLKRGPPSA